ncbi:MAG: lipocalin family protein [Pseudomonadota bacterium]
MNCTQRVNIKQRLIALALLAATSVVACQSEPPLEVAPKVELSQLQGKWYEIARLPRSTQVDCHGTTAFYKQAPDGSLSLVNQCNVGSATGKLQTISMTATVPDTNVPAKLSLDVGGYTGDYWILEVGSNYEYAVVGHPSRLYFWILSRKPTLDSNVLGGILSRAEDKHFDTSLLEFTPQPPAADRDQLDKPQGAVPEAPHSTCALSGAPGGSQRGQVSGFCVSLGISLLGLRRRRARR